MAELKDQQVIVMLTKAELSRFVVLCERYGLTRSEMGRRVFENRLDTEKIPQPRRSELADGDGFEYDATLVPGTGE